MDILLFTDAFKEKLKANPLEYVDTFYLTNTVMHASTISADKSTPRARFWGTPLASRGDTPSLKLLSNDDTPTANYRLDTCAGRFLSFTKEVSRGGKTWSGRFSLITRL